MKGLALVLAPAALLALALPAPADEIVLKNGRTLVGEATESGDSVVFEKSGIRMEIRKDEVLEVRKAPTAKEELAKRLAELAKAEKPSAEAFHRLGLWCGGKGLKAEAKDLQEKAIALDPDHEGARRALGFVRADGKWRPEEEVMAEKGLVRSGGRWVTKEEAAAGPSPSAREAERLAAKERERRLKKGLNAALRKVAAEDAETRALGERDLVAVAKEMGDTDLEARAPEVRAYYDEVYGEIRRARAMLEIRAKVVTLKRPIPRFTTSLGAFSSPVTLQLPELSVISINTTAVVPLQVEED
jgi:hypothetical protein